LHVRHEHLSRMQLIGRVAAAADEQMSWKLQGLCLFSFKENKESFKQVPSQSNEEEGKEASRQIL